MESASNNVRIAKIIYSGFLFFFQVIIFLSCNNKENKSEKTENTLGSGTVKVISDPTFKPLMGTSASTFEALHPGAKINLEYQPQEKAILNLVEGKTDVVISGRPLTEAEEVRIRNRGLFLKSNKIASDGLVFIVSKENKDKQISEEKIAQILSGTLKMKLVCDQSNSSNIVYLKNRFNLSNEVQNVQAAGSDSAVIEYVIKHPEAIGIIGMALVSDLEDPKVKSRLLNINLLSILYKDSTGNAVTGHPTTEDLAIQKYPFIRDIFIINLDGNTRLGTGFANYMVSEKAQRIVLKSGLLPFQLPGREIIIND
jgi:phosphate transport system substrate-binding protein